MLLNLFISYLQQNGTKRKSIQNFTCRVFIFFKMRDFSYLRVFFIYHTKTVPILHFYSVDNHFHNLFPLILLNNPSQLYNILIIRIEFSVNILLHRLITWLCVDKRKIWVDKFLSLNEQNILNQRNLCFPKTDMQHLIKFQKFCSFIGLKVPIGSLKI